MADKMARTGQYEFRFRWSLFIVLILLLALGISLGYWQMGRAHEKELTENLKEKNTLQDIIRLQASDTVAGPMLYRDVEIDGVFSINKQILLDNQKYNGRPGYHVFTPLRLSKSNTYVLVGRGWVRQGSDRRFIPDLPGPVDSVHIQGKVGNIPVVGIKLGEPGESGEIWPKRLIYMDLDWLEKETGYRFLPYVVYQTKGEEFGFVRDWRQQFQSGNMMSSEKHMGYALQWFALTALAIIMYLILSIKKSTREADSGDRS